MGANSKQYLNFVEEDWERVSLIERGYIMEKEMEEYCMLKRELFFGNTEKESSFVKSTSHVRKYISPSYSRTIKATSKSFSLLAFRRALNKKTKQRK